MLNKITGFIAKNYQGYAILAALFGYIGLMLLINLRSMIPVLQREGANVLMIDSGRSLLENIMFLPISIWQYALLKLDTEIVDLRFVSVAFALIACVILYALLIKWHTRRVAFATLLLFGSSSIFLTISRYATHEVLYFSALPLLILCASWLRKKKDVSKLPIASLFTMLLMYLPGLWIFITIGLIALRKRIFTAWRLNSTRIKVVTVSISSLTLVPLIYGLLINTENITKFLGVPSLDKLSLTQIKDNFLSLFDSLFWTGFDDRAMWLTGTPILDVFMIAAIILGIYSYYFGYHPMRKRVLFAYSLVAILIITLGFNVSIALLIPVLFIFMASGIALMLQQWFTVFPKNPLAHLSAVVLLSTVIALSCFYQTQRYFIAWPSSIETKQSIEKNRL